MTTFSSVIQIVLIVSVALFVSCIGIYGCRASIKNSYRHQNAVRSLACFTILPFLLAWAQYEAGMIKLNSEREVRMVHDWSPHREAAIKMYYGNGQYALILIGVSGIAWIGAALLVQKRGHQ